MATAQRPSRSTEDNMAKKQGKAKAAAPRIRKGDQTKLVEPKIVHLDDVNPDHRWHRPLQAPGHTQVDFEERVDFQIDTQECFVQPLDHGLPLRLGRESTGRGAGGRYGGGLRRLVGDRPERDARVGQPGSVRQAGLPA